MPNWTTNIVTITGSKKTLETIKNNIFSKDENGDMVLDFNKIIPQPEEIKNTVSDSHSNFFQEFVKTDCKINYNNWIDFIKSKYHNWDILLFTEKRFNELKHLYDTYGCCDWYEWNVKNWDTKWEPEACNVFEEQSNTYPFADGLHFEFLTAWSSPMKILEKIMETYPDCDYRIEGQDEGGFGGFVYMKVQEEEGEYFPTQETYYGEREDGVQVLVEYDDDTDEWKDFEGNVYEDIITEFEAVV
jgi:hypothetical protein